MQDETTIQAEALQFAKRNRQRIANQVTNKKIYLPDDIPVSVFMAGSPGAGKTEFSKNLIDSFESSKQKRYVVRIDGDELRSMLPGYIGTNSHLFQPAISVLIERIYDTVLKNKQTFILDGTFSKYEKAEQNIQRSLDKGRVIFIFYVYQEPQIAWQFTQAREKAEGRNIPKEAFIHQFFGAKETVNRIRKKFDVRNVVIFLVKKNYKTHTVEDIIQCQSQDDVIDNYIQETYTEEQLIEIL